MGNLLGSILSGICSEVELTGFVPGLLGGRTFFGVLFFGLFRDFLGIIHWVG